MASKCFSVDISSSRLSENHESNFSLVAQGPTEDINDSFCESEKKVYY